MPRTFVAVIVIALSVISCKESLGGRSFPQDEIREADLAFRCGEGVFSRMVTAAGECSVYSHVGIVVRDSDRWRVVHAVPREREFPGDFDRVKVEDLDVFFSEERACKGCLVHTGLADEQAVKALCGKALAAAADSLHFDNDYDLDDSSSVYCTEFVWRLFKDRGTDLSEGRRRKVHVLHIDSEIILPEHLLAYKDNDIYYSF